VSEVDGASKQQVHWLPLLYSSTVLARIGANAGCVIRV
jgi:hypothetical protein